SSSIIPRQASSWFVSTRFPTRACCEFGWTAKWPSNGNCRAEKGSGRKAEQWKLWETTYDEDVAVDVPAGKCRIRVENFGKDWVAVTKYTFTGCKIVDGPDVLVCGMKTSGLAMLWLQNKRSSWYNHAGGGKVGRVDAFELAVEGLSNGRYRLQWWETWKGRLERVEVLIPERYREGRLMLAVPGLSADMAVKIRPITD
ncbi:hypothetical protein ACFL5Q_08190, partial [Planctomycetota bacterium]